MKLIIALTAIALVYNSYFMVDLLREQLMSNGGQNTNEHLDNVYYSDVKFEHGERYSTLKSTYDLTLSDNFAVDSTCQDAQSCGDLQQNAEFTCKLPCLNPVSKQTNPDQMEIEGAAYSIEIPKDNISIGEDTINVDGQELKNIPLVFPTKFEEDANDNYAPNTIKSSFSLLRQDPVNISKSVHSKNNNNFIKDVVRQVDGVKKQQVSFHFGANKDDNSMIIGDTEDYFKDGPSETFKNEKCGENKNWGLMLQQIRVEGQDENLFQAGDQEEKKDSTCAVFHSTSEYIYLPQEMVENLSNQLDQSTSCSQPDTDGPIECTCTKDCSEAYNKLPTISFTFKNPLSSNDEPTQYEMKGEDYVLPNNTNNNKNFKLIFRSQTVYNSRKDFKKRHFASSKSKSEEKSKSEKKKKTKEDGEDVDSEGYPPLKTKKSNYVWLGTGWLRNFYTAFDQDNNQIKMARAVRSTGLLGGGSNRGLHLDRKWGWPLVGLGTLLGLGAIAAIIGLLYMIKMPDMDAKNIKQRENYQLVENQKVDQVQQGEAQKFINNNRENVRQIQSPSRVQGGITYQSGVRGPAVQNVAQKFANNIQQGGGVQRTNPVGYPQQQRY